MFGVVNTSTNDDYYNIANSWEGGGTTSFAVYVKYDSFNMHSSVFEFGNGVGDDRNAALL